jgi:hypothetical protein
MGETVAGSGIALRVPVRRGRVDVERLTARIRVLLEEAAHQGAVALQLLLQSREAYGLAEEGREEAYGALVRDLERRLAAAEREARQRLRRSRLALVGARPRPRAAR